MEMGPKSIRQKRISSNIDELFVLSRSICRQRQLLLLDIKRKYFNYFNMFFDFE